MKSAVRMILATAAMIVAGAVSGQNFPNRTVTLTVGFAPGGGADTAARLIARKLGENLGVSVVVENKAGAGGNIAAQHIATAAPDGYTIHLTSVGPMAVAPHVMKDLSYDPKRDIAPITMGVVFPNVLVVYSGVPAKTLAEFVALAKQKPGKLTYGSSGVGGAGHLAGELFKERAGIDVIHVPYKGGGPAMVALLAGETNLGAQSPGVSSPHIKSGKIRVLGSWAGTRTAALPDVPTMKEQGFDVEFYIWAGVFAPAGLPSDVAERIRTAVRQGVQDPEFKSAMAGINTPINFLEGAEFERFLDTDTRRLAAVVQKMGKTE